MKALQVGGVATANCSRQIGNQQDMQAADDLWTMEGPSEHADKIKSGEVNRKIPHKQFGVKERPGFIVVAVDHYMFPTLHLMIGPHRNLGRPN
jgi:hypothetical protein